MGSRVAVTPTPLSNDVTVDVVVSITTISQASTAPVGAAAIPRPLGGSATPVREFPTRAGDVSRLHVISRGATMTSGLPHTSEGGVTRHQLTNRLDDTAFTSRRDSHGRVAVGEWLWFLLSALMIGLAFWVSLF